MVDRLKKLGRIRKVRWWKRQGGGYFTTIEGRQVLLVKGPKDEDVNGPTWLAALARFKEVSEQHAGIQTDGMTLRGILSLYGEELERSRTRKPSFYSQVVERFVALHGDKRVRELTAHDVETFVRSVAEWNDTTQNSAGGMILSALNWAARVGHIPANPLKGRVKLPEQNFRGRDARMSKELMDVLDAACEEAGFRSDSFKVFLWAMRETGARPEELRHATPHHYRNGRIVFPWKPAAGDYRWKNAKKTQKDRTIFVAGKLREWIEERVRKVGAKSRLPLFPTNRGLRYTQQNFDRQWRELLGTKRVREYMKEHGVQAESLKPYNYRHTWISDFLDDTGNIYVCAKMTGTSVAMIEKTYGHPDDDLMYQRYADFVMNR